MRKDYINEDKSINRDKIIEDFGGEENIAKIAEALAQEDLGDFDNATDWFINNFVDKLNDIDFADIGAHLTNSVKTAFDTAKEALYAKELLSPLTKFSKVYLSFN